MSRTSLFAGLLGLSAAVLATPDSDLTLNPTLTRNGPFINCVNTTDDITLAVKPACGSLNSATFAELNTGVNTSNIK
jgi:hypothetical protein